MRDEFPPWQKRPTIARIAESSSYCFGNLYGNHTPSF